MTPSTPRTANDVLRSLRVITLAAVGTTIAVTIMVVLATPDANHFPHAWAMATVAILGILASISVRTVGFVMPAIPPSTSRDVAEAEALKNLHAGTIFRLGIAMAPVMTGMLLSFLTAIGGFFLTAFGAAITLSLISLYVWPGPGPINRTEAALNREGGRSYLRKITGIKRT